LKDRAKDHDAAVCDDEKPDCVEKEAELSAGEDAGEEEQGAYFHRGNRGWVEDFCCKYALNGRSLSVWLMKR